MGVHAKKNTSRHDFSSGGKRVKIHIIRSFSSLFRVGVDLFRLVSSNGTNMSSSSPRFLSLSDRYGRFFTRNCRHALKPIFTPFEGLERSRTMIAISQKDTFHRVDLPLAWSENLLRNVSFFFGNVLRNFMYKKFDY